MVPVTNVGGKMVSVQLHKAQRLQRDMKINLRGLTMPLDLVEEVHDMRRQVDRLNRMLGRFMDGWQKQ